MNMLRTSRLLAMPVNPRPLLAGILGDSKIYTIKPTKSLPCVAQMASRQDSDGEDRRENFQEIDQDLRRFRQKTMRTNMQSPRTRGSTRAEVDEIFTNSPSIESRVLQSLVSALKNNSGAVHDIKKEMHLRFGFDLHVNTCAIPSQFSQTGNERLYIAAHVTMSDPAPVTHLIRFPHPGYADIATDIPERFRIRCGITTIYKSTSETFLLALKKAADHCAKLQGNGDTSGYNLMWCCGSCKVTECRSDLVFSVPEGNFQDFKDTFWQRLEVDPAHLVQT